jgi:hypothetical protein
MRAATLIKGQGAGGGVCDLPFPAVMLVEVRAPRRVESNELFPSMVVVHRPKGAGQWAAKL